MIGTELRMACCNQCSELRQLIGFSDPFSEREIGNPGIAQETNLLKSYILDDHILIMFNKILQSGFTVFHSRFHAVSEVTKVFQGGSLEQFKAELEQHFDKVQ